MCASRWVPLGTGQGCEGRQSGRQPRTTYRDLPRTRTERAAERLWISSSRGAGAGAGGAKGRTCAAARLWEEFSLYFSKGVSVTAGFAANTIGMLCRRCGPLVTSSLQRAGWGWRDCTEIGTLFFLVRCTGKISTEHGDGYDEKVHGLHSLIYLLVRMANCAFLFQTSFFTSRHHKTIAVIRTKGAACLP